MGTSTETIIYIIEIIIGSVSLVSNLFIILVFLFCRELRSFTFEIVVNLSIASFGTTLAYLIYFDFHDISGTTQGACVAQGFMMIIFELSQIIWTTILVIYLYRTVINYNSNSLETRQQIIKMRFLFYGLGYIFPLAFSSASLGLNLIGHSGAWCWHSKVKSESLFKLFSEIEYFIVWLGLIISLVFSILIRKKVKQIYSNTREYSNVTKHILQLCIYPVIMLTYLLPNSVYRILFTFFHFKTPYFDYFVIFVNVLEGFLYAFSFVYFYGFTMIWNEFKENLINFIKFKKEDKSTTNPYGSFYLDNDNTRPRQSFDSLIDLKNI